MLPTSRTLDSLVELAPKTSTPSASSSGYGSQAVSSTNLTNDDAMSLRSISVDETPDIENKLTIVNDLKPVTEIIGNENQSTAQVSELFYKQKEISQYSRKLLHG